MPTRQVIKKILKIIGTGIRLALELSVLAFLAFEVYVIYLDKTGGEALLADLPVQIYEVTSDSMYPKFRTGDGLVIYDLPFTSVKEKDIISFYQNGEIITHQVVRINEDETVTTMGLMNGTEDAPVSESDYIGKAILILPGLTRYVGSTTPAANKVLMGAIFFVICFGRPILGGILNKIYPIRAGEEEAVSRETAGKQEADGEEKTQEDRRQ